MIYEADIDLNLLVLKFDQIILLPADIRNYTSQNFGEEIFKVEYFPSESTIAYRYENEIEVTMTWKVEKADPEKIEILLEFSDKSAVSINPHDPDKV